MKNLIFVFVLSAIFFSTQHIQAQIFDKIKKETEKVIQKETQKPPEVKKEEHQLLKKKTIMKQKNPPIQIKQTKKPLHKNLRTILSSQVQLSMILFPVIK